MKIIQDSEFKIAIFQVDNSLHVTVMETSYETQFADEKNELTDEGHSVIDMLKGRIANGKHPNVVQENDEGVPLTFAYTRIRRNEFVGSSYIVIVK